jgi:regulator of replication initiation timing
MDALPSTINDDTLPALVDRAASALMSARDSAEVLEARDMAKVAYDAAKSAGRIVRAKKAHDDVIAAVYRAQGHALAIEARAKIKLADEYDGAQERGEVQPHGGQMPRDVAEHNIPSAADLGLRRDEIHEARQLRDAELAEPGIVERVISARAEAREEPTKAALREAVSEANNKPATSPAANAASAPSEADRLRAEIAELRDQIAEMTSQYEEVVAENASLAAVFEANDKVAEAMAEAKKFRELYRIEKERSNSLMNEKNAAVRAAKSWQRKAGAL